MPRDGSPARARLRQAALDLYRERGYEDTTTAQIAERAGVTERTYFRHFSDKREVLFDGETELRKILVEAIAAAPVSLSPLATLVRAFRAAVPLLVANRPVAVERTRVIAVTPALQERAFTKTAALTDALAVALAARGVSPATAQLAAQVSMAAFSHAARRWDEDPTAQLGGLIDQAAEEVLRLGDA